MTKPQFIGLGGLLRSGKDATADYLVEKHGWVKMGMSDPLHESMLALDPIVSIKGHENKDAIWLGHYPRYSFITEKIGYTEAKKIPEYRRLLQRFGTEVIRDIIGPDTWVDIARRRALAYMAEGKSVALTGIRFPNELQMVQELGRTVWVERPGLESEGTHASEGSVKASDFEFTLHNSGTLSDLFGAADMLVSFV